MTRWLLVFVLTGIFSACDDGDANDDTDTSADGDADGDGDGDADADSDADADGDFPGNCECAARFTFDGEMIDICSSLEQNCRCYIDSDDEMSCIWLSDAVDERLYFYNFPTWDMAVGEQHSSDDAEWGIVTSIGVRIDSESYSGGFDIVFDNFSGIGNTVSGTFTARVSDDADQNFYDITDGQFYAPVVEQ